MSDPFYEGQEAALRGDTEDMNPYDLLDDEESHLLWNDGWASGNDGYE